MKKVSEINYLQSAPADLIALHKYGTSQGREILGRLLTYNLMKRAWRELSHHIKSKPQWLSLWQEIAYILLQIKKMKNKKSLSRDTEKKAFQKIAKRAKKLAHECITNEQDLKIYEFFPIDVIKILCGTVDWQTLNSIERAAKANEILNEWPTISELLEELASQCSNLADNPRRDVVQRKTRDSQKLYFCRALTDYFNKKYRANLYGTVANIASVIFGCKVKKEFVVKAAKGCQ